MTDWYFGLCEKGRQFDEYTQKDGNSMTEATRIIEIFSGTPWQTGMVKSLLDDAGIEAFLAACSLQLVALFNLSLHIIYLP